MIPKPKTAREKYIGKIANDKSLKTDALAPKTPTEKYLKEIAENSANSSCTLEERTKLLFSDGGNVINFAPNPQVMGLYSAVVWIGDNVPGDQPEDWPESMDVIFDGVSYTIPRYIAGTTFNIAYGYSTADEIGEEIPDFSQAPIMFGVMYDLNVTSYQYGLVFVTNSTEPSHNIFISYKTKEAVPSKEFEEARGFVANKVGIIPDQIVKSGDTLLANATEFIEIAQKLGNLPPLWITYNGEISKIYPTYSDVNSDGFYLLDIDNSIHIDRSNFSATFNGMPGEKLISACYVREPEVDPDFIEASLKANEPLELPVTLEITLANGVEEFRGNVFVPTSMLLRLFKSGRKIFLKASTGDLSFTTELTTNGNDAMLSGFTFMLLPNGDQNPPIYAGVATYVWPYSNNPDSASTVRCRLYTLTPLLLD